MSNGYIQLPADSTGKKVDTEELSVGGNTVERERIQVCGTADTQIAPVDATAGLKVNLGADNDVTVTSGNIALSAAIPAGANTIGGVNVIAALPAGANNIGDVDVLTMPGTAAEAGGLPAVFHVVAGDDGTDTHPLQLSATGDMKVTLDSETVDVSDRAARDCGKIDIAAFDASLPMGSNAIGKLAANSGIDIGDVDVLSIAAGDNNIGNVDIASAIPTGANKIGVVAQDITGPCAGATALTPKFIKIDCASSGDNTIVAAVVGKKIRVLAVVMVASGGANTVTWKDGATAVSGGMGFAANGGYSIECQYGLWEGTANTILYLNLSAATSVDGHITYVEV